MMSNRVDRYCLTCGNVTVVDAGYYAGSSFYQCETCGRRGTSDIFPKATVFHKITSSPEVLAPEFVGMMYNRVCGNYLNYSMLTGEWYATHAEAIAATVAKLKEVEE
jgi:hypothetical protein